MSQPDINFLNFSGKELNPLFEAAKAGDTLAFDKLSATVQKLAHGYFLSKFHLGKIKNIEDVEDLTGNVWLSFARQYKKVENIEFWLRRVLFLTFVSFYKKAKKTKVYDADAVLRKKRVEFNFGENTDSEKIMAIVANMSQEKQQILRMRFWEDLKFNEIAEALNKTEDAIKKMFYRLITEIQDKIK